METAAAIREEARADALSIHALSLFYGAFRALDRVSLGVGRGEFLALLGPSGCGKTSLLRCIAGFAAPREGGILLNGRNLLGLKPRDRNLGFVFQQYALFPHMTAFENVGFGLECRGVKGAAAGQRIRDALALVGLADLAERRPRQLSGGQQQRVALARAIVFEPDMLLLDEPLAALDKQLRVQMQTELKSLQSRLGITSVFVTHDQEEAMAMAGRIAVMRGGRVVQFGAPEDIYANPVNAWVGEFIGAGNLLSGRVTATQRTRICFDSDSGMRFEVEQATPAPPSPLLFFRPESVSLVAPSHASSFTVVARRFLGTNVELHLESSGQNVRAIVAASVARTIAQGAMTGISVAPSDCRLLAAGDGS